LSPNACVSAAMARHQAAKALSLSVPLWLLGRADEVIE
jgi:hypothetical protein